MKPIHLHIHCPANDWRTKRDAVVEINLAKIRCKYNLGDSWPFKNDVNPGIKVVDSSDNSIPFQIDRIDPHDSSRDMLLFNAHINEINSEYYIMEGSTDKTKLNVSIKAIDENNYYFEMENNLIKFKFRLDPWLGTFGGSAHDIQFKRGNETISPFGISWMNKFMQIENIYISEPFNIPSPRGLYPPDGYNYVAHGEGPLRCYLSIRYPFDLEFERSLSSGPGKFINQYKCFLYRFISLFYDKYYVKEEIYVRAEKCKMMYAVNGEKRELREINTIDFDIPLEFETQFFMNVPYIAGYNKKTQITGPNIKYEPDKITSPIEAWFAVGDNSPPNCLGIGFASNCHMKALPNRQFPIGDAYRWLISPTWHLTCLHQFMNKTNIAKHKEDVFGGVIGDNWHDMIYTPIWCG